MKTKLLGILICSMVVLAVLRAADTVWRDSASGTWGNASLWSAGVPNDALDVYVGNGSISVTNMTVTANTLFTSYSDILGLPSNTTFTISNSNVTSNYIGLAVWLGNPTSGKTILRLSGNSTITAPIMDISGATSIALGSSSMVNLTGSPSGSYLNMGGNAVISVNSTNGIFSSASNGIINISGNSYLLVNSNINQSSRNGVYLCGANSFISLNNTANIAVASNYSQSNNNTGVHMNADHIDAELNGVSFISVSANRADGTGSLTGTATGFYITSNNSSVTLNDDSFISTNTSSTGWNSTAVAYGIKSIGSGTVINLNQNATISLRSTSLLANFSSGRSIGIDSAANTTITLSDNAKIYTAQISSNGGAIAVSMGNNSSITLNDSSSIVLNGTVYPGWQYGIQLGNNNTCVLNGNSSIQIGNSTTGIVNGITSLTSGSNVILNGNSSIHVGFGGNGINFRLDNYSTSSNIRINDSASIIGSHNTVNLIHVYASSSVYDMVANVLIGDNALLSTGTITLSGYEPRRTSITTSIRDFATLQNINVSLDQGAVLEIAAGSINQVHSITINNIYNGSSSSGVVHFTGPTNQTLIITGSNNFSNITFSDDGIVRGSLIKDGTGTFTLDKQNTLRGEITPLQGTILLNNLQAADTATVNFTTTGNINYGDAIGTRNLTLGGISGNGTFDTSRNSTRNYFIGNNSYDSLFNGSITGSGNITKVGNGTLTLDAVTTAYSKQITVGSGRLHNIGTISSSPIVVQSNATLHNEGTVSALTTLQSNARFVAQGATHGNITLQGITDITAIVEGSGNALIADTLIAPNGLNITLDLSLAQNGLGSPAITLGTLTKTGGVFTFNLINIDESVIKEYTILSITGSGIGINEMDFSVQAPAGYSWAYDQIDQTLRISAINVPEPSTYVLIFAGLFLAVAPVLRNRRMRLLR